MVTLFCAVDGVEESVFSVDIDPEKTVIDLKEVIAGKLTDTYTGEPKYLKLFLAKKVDGGWLPDDDDLDKMLQNNVDTSEMKKLRAPQHLEDLFGTGASLGKNVVHVLVVLPSAELAVTPGQKRPRTEVEVTTPAGITPIDPETMSNIASYFDLDSWEVNGGLALSINRVEPSFPDWFYVRKETLDLVKVFNENVRLGLNTVFVGTPGVGKSTLVVVLAFYMALRLQKRVVLLRKLRGGGYTMLYLDPEHEHYWRKSTRVAIADLDLVVSSDFELCLDGFLQSEIDYTPSNFSRLTKFRMLATSVQYDMKNDETEVRRRCLVPFWSKADITRIGQHYGWADLDIKERYYYSGGNLRDFLMGEDTTRSAIDQAVDVVTLLSVEVLISQLGSVLSHQVDRLRMVTVTAATDSRDPSNLKKYWKSGQWVCVVTSEYALRSLAKIVKPSYYKELWSRARIIRDDGLMEIAFENYVHTTAMSGETIELQVRPYDWSRTNQHTYATGKIKASNCRNEGRNAEECQAIMAQLKNVDYWYPLDRCLGTIDSVAKLSMGQEQNVTALIRITKSDELTIDSEALSGYAMLCLGDVRYVALVPDKGTSDNFRFNPANPPTKVPLRVAYLADWVS